jgi:hypothetical protein
MTSQQSGNFQIVLYFEILVRHSFTIDKAYCNPTGQAVGRQVILHCIGGKAASGDLLVSTVYAWPRYQDKELDGLSESPYVHYVGVQYLKMGSLRGCWSHLVSSLYVGSLRN